jgi:hypothetical protein
MPRHTHNETPAADFPAGVEPLPGCLSTGACPDKDHEYLKPRQAPSPAEPDPQPSATPNADGSPANPEPLPGCVTTGACPDHPRYHEVLEAQLATLKAKRS